MLPKNTPMGRLRLAEVLDSYDGPKLVIARSEIGTAYLGLWVETLEAGDVWLFVPMSEQRRVELLEGEISLRDAYFEAEDGFVFRVVMKGREDRPSFSLIRCGDLDPSDLPPEDDFLEPLARSPMEALPCDAESTARHGGDPLERLYLRPANRNHVLHQDVVASTWQAWFSCRQATIQAKRPKSAGVPAAVGAAVHSFAVDLAVSNPEVNTRMILDWARYVEGVGTGNVRNRMVESGIDSQLCENLLHTIVASSVHLNVTLLWPHDNRPNVGF